MDQFKKHQAIILSTWVIFLAVSIIGSGYYAFHANDEGILFITNDDLYDLLFPISVTYGSYLGAILVAYFTKPISASFYSAEKDSYYFYLALILTIGFNLIINYFVYRSYFVDDPDLIKDFNKLEDIALWFSFMVAPVNLFYFGVRVRES